MSSIGRIANWITGDKGSTSVTSQVKNPALQQLIDRGVSDYSGIRDSGRDALASFTQRYLADNPAATTRTNQEVGTIDRFYNGGIESDLLGLRNSRYAAARGAADRAGLGALRGLNSARLLGSGTPGSYDRRLHMRNMADIETQLALQSADQERADWNYAMANRLGLVGRRQAMIDANTGRVLYPEQLRRNFYGQDLGYLGALGELDRGNKFYGLEYDPSIGDEIGGLFGDAVSDARGVAGVMSAFGGTGGPVASPTVNQRTMLSSGGGPVRSRYADAYLRSLMNGEALGIPNYAGSYWR